MKEEIEITPEELSRLGRYMAQSRRIVPGVCEVCGKSFEGTTKRRFCSNACRVKAHRMNKRQDQGEACELKYRGGYPGAVAATSGMDACATIGSRMYLT
jgi:hypothetical protein